MTKHHQKLKILHVISFLSGTVGDGVEDAFTILVNGVGYLVHMPKNIKENISPGQEINLHIHTQVREDQISLFGFLDLETLFLFKKLLSVSGIGPKIAVEIVSFPAEKIIHAIESEDSEFLSSIPGIGKKTAGRVILELKNKLPSSGLSLAVKSKEKDDYEAIDALLNLGFPKNRILEVLGSEDIKTKSTEEKVKFFLQNT